MPSRNRNLLITAFTLIELLVVVAIIALLISILLPSLHRAKAQARQVMCMTNMRSQGEAARFYMADNGGWLPRGIQGFAAGNEYHIYSTAILSYLGWDGDIELGLHNANKLWGNRHGVSKETLSALLRKVPQFQCADYPLGAEQDQNAQTLTNPVDYVASAFPIPYLESSINADTAGELEWDAEGGYEGENVPGYRPCSKLDRVAGRANPAGIIYVTEAHTSLPWSNREGLRFHHVFLGSQLPFGGKPRMANDQRHPGGINALFFDGHGENMDFHYIDPGWPNPLSRRLRWFTVMPDGYE
jgi:prepilin-type processing-associated H-X9-DG protein/prepilin-type N-terminal cleavage/methylation domain-containing protein